MRAVILAGGKGSRLKPYTNLIPKPLVPIGNDKSILEIIINQLASQGFKHITIAVNHFSKLIQSYFGDGNKYKVRIDYSEERKSLGTFGPLLIIKDLPQNFLVLNGDTLTNLNYKNFFLKHCRSKSEITLATTKRKEKLNYGILTFKNNKLFSFKEKPKIDMNVGMGIYGVNKSIIIKNLPKKIKKIDFNEIFEKRLKLKMKTSIYNFSGFWLDIGRPEDYEFANYNLKLIKSKIKI